jgi:hypothetical protein
MCHAVDSWSAALLLLFFLTVAIHAGFQLHFLKKLERLHPDEWAELLDRDAWGDESSATYAAGLWYLLSGQYRSLGDNQLAVSAFRARFAAIVSVVAFASWVAFAAITLASPNFKCLLGLVA